MSGAGMARPDYETTLRRALLALVVGAVVGAVLIPIETLVPGAFYDARVGGLIGAPPERVLDFALLIAISAFLAFAVGLAVLGAPSWWLLHRLGRRSWYDAAALGFILTFASVLLLYIYSSVAGGHYSASDSGGPLVVDNTITAHGWTKFIEESALAALAGALVGLTVWRVAYRKRMS